MESTKTKIAILISGRGSNMVALAEAVGDGSIPNAEIAIVISDQPKASGIELASQRGLKTKVIDRRGRSRQDHEREIIAVLREHSIDLICLAGYMRLLSSEFVAAFKGKILNIHPSLLPSFPGLEAQRQALEHGAKWTGCTVHLVDDTLDGGPIVAQHAIPVFEDDTEASLAERLLREEHKLYAEAVGLIVSGRYRVVGRRVLREN